MPDPSGQSYEAPAIVDRGESQIRKGLKNRCSQHVGQGSVVFETVATRAESTHRPDQGGNRVVVVTKRSLPPESVRSYTFSQLGIQAVGALQHLLESRSILQRQRQCDDGSIVPVRRIVNSRIQDTEKVIRGRPQQVLPNVLIKVG